MVDQDDESFYTAENMKYLGTGRVKTSSWGSKNRHGDYSLLFEDGKGKIWCVRPEISLIEKNKIDIIFSGERIVLDKRIVEKEEISYTIELVK